MTEQKHFDLIAKFGAMTKDELTEYKDDLTKRISKLEYIECSQDLFDELEVVQDLLNLMNGG